MVKSGVLNMRIFMCKGTKYASLIATLHVKSLALVLPDLVMLTVMAFALVLLSFISFKTKYF